MSDRLKLKINVDDFLYHGRIEFDPEQEGFDGVCVDHGDTVSVCVRFQAWTKVTVPYEPTDKREAVAQRLATAAREALKSCVDLARERLAKLP